MNDLLERPEAKEASAVPLPPKSDTRERPAKAAAPRASQTIDEDGEGVFQRHRLKLIAATVLVVGGVGAALLLKDGKPAQMKAPERTVVNIQLPPPPPPPPAPPPPPPQTAPKIEQQKEEMIKEDKPDEQPPEEPKPADDPPPLGTGIKGDGAPDGFGLSGSGTGRIGGTGTGGGGGRSKYGWYAGQVQRTVGEALRTHKKTRKARFNALEVRIWPDPATGRVRRVSLSPSTGDPSLDEAIRDEVLGGLQLQQPPPEGMPAPIVMRVAARRP